MSTYTSIFNQWNEVLKITGSNYDKQLLEIKKKLSQAESLIQGALFMQDYRDFSVKYASASSFEICGYFPENFYSNGIELGLQLHHPEDRSNVLVFQKQVFDYIQTIPFKYRDTIEVSYICRIFNKKKQEYNTVHATIKPLLFDNEYNVIFDIAHWKIIPELSKDDIFRYSIKYQDQNGKVHEKNSTTDANKSSFDILTKTELEITALLQKGLTSSEISQKLNRSKHTVDTHRRNILKKLGLKSTKELLINFS